MWGSCSIEETWTPRLAGRNNKAETKRGRLNRACFLKKGARKGKVKKTRALTCICTWQGLDTGLHSHAEVSASQGRRQKTGPPLKDLDSAGQQLDKKLQKRMFKIVKANLHLPAERIATSERPPAETRLKLSLRMSWSMRTKSLDSWPAALKAAWIRTRNNELRPWAVRGLEGSETEGKRHGELPKRRSERVRNS